MNNRINFLLFIYLIFCTYPFLKRQLYTFIFSKFSLIYLSFCQLFLLYLCLVLYKIIICWFSVHGSWSTWADWSACSLTCGSTGTRSRSRYCDLPYQDYADHDCFGSNVETQKCNTFNCPST